MTSTRDNQKSKVYAAERDALEPLNEGLLSKEECAEFIDKIFSSTWVINKWAKPRRPRLRFSRGYGGAHFSTWANEIMLTGQAKKKWVILHEAAHAIVWSAVWPQPASHGWEFCDVYLALTRHFLGAEAADRLKAEFKAHRVRFTKPRKRKPLTPEQRAVLAERLAKAREAKAAAQRV